jgi:signal transduction histidine kinase
MTAWLASEDALPKLLRMPESTARLFSDASPEALLETLLEVSLTGVIFFEPIYASDGTSITDLAYRHLNPAAQRMLTLPQRPADTFLTLYPNALESGIFAFYRDTFLSGKAGRYDVNYSYDGLDNYFHLVARRSRELLIVSFTDTSDQDRTDVEEALRLSQSREQQARAEAEVQRQRLHDILMQLPAQVAINRGPDHVYELVNPRYQQQFPLRSIQGLPVREALPELAGQQFFELLDQVYQTGEPFYGQQMPAQVDYTHSGRMELRYFDVFFQALRNAQGHVDGILNFAYDVTAQVLARQQVEQLNQELEVRVQERTGQLAVINKELHGSNTQLTRTNLDLNQANSNLNQANTDLKQVNSDLNRVNTNLDQTNRDLDNFIYTASHDLKAPILNIEGLIKVLSRKVSPSQKQDAIVQEIIALIEASVLRFKETIGDLTDIARIQKQMDLEYEPVDLQEIVSAILLDLTQPIEQAAARIEIFLENCPPVLFPRKNLKSVVYNLLSNAIKYSDPHRTPHITLSCREEGDYQVLSVQDNGLGMDTRNPDKIFGMFKRQHAHVEGTGVGLYIVKKMLENAGGKIELQSTVGEGSTFKVYFKQ